MSIPTPPPPAPLNTPEELELARELGRLAGAQGAAGSTANPYIELSNVWADGYAEVVARVQKGEDRGGHTGEQPHLCLGATRANAAVCNCCPGCARDCVPSVRETLEGMGHAILHRMGLRRTP